MEVDYSQQPGLELIGHHHQGQHSELTPKTGESSGHAYAPGWNAVPADFARPQRQICGLRPVTFGLIVAIVFLVAAAAVGGGVGGSIAVKNAQDKARAEALASVSTQTTSKPSATTSANTYAVTTLAWGPVFTDPLPSSGCPGNNNTIYSSINGPQNWRIYCNLDMPGYDLIQTNTPNLQLCIETCANWNTASLNVPKCMGVAFVPKFILGAKATSPPSDCYLKSNASIAFLIDKTSEAIEYDSVIVQS